MFHTSIALGATRRLNPLVSFQDITRRHDHNCLARRGVAWGGLFEPKPQRKVLVLLVLLLLLLLVLLLLLCLRCTCHRLVAAGWLVGWLLFMLLLLLLMCEIVFVDLAQRARGTCAGTIPGTCTGHGRRRGQCRNESAGHRDKPRGHGRVGGPTPQGWPMPTSAHKPVPHLPCFWCGNVGGAAARV